MREGAPLKRTLAFAMCTVGAERLLASTSYNLLDLACQVKTYHHIFV